MFLSILATAVALLTVVNGSALPVEHRSALTSRAPAVSSRDTAAANCLNTATSRDCWGAYNLDTDYYTTWPNTGVVRTYNLEVVNKTLGPDGVERQTLSFNGQIPGPAITADWGDTIVVNVKNSLTENGTSIHWHGVRQLNSNQYDGVPGVTECPIPPGDTMTYTFQATQYGSSWYHSHFTLQLGDGLFGPINIRGPTTADWDEDLGTMILQDWAHQSVFDIWGEQAIFGLPPSLPSGLINGTNTWNCTAADGPTCTGGQRFTTTFQPGKRYLIRLVNAALNGWIRFSIDNHNFTVVANDFVPIEPWTTNSITLGIGQRYDIVVQALSNSTGSHWIRADWPSCNSNNTAGNAGDIKGILHYEGCSQSGNPTSTSSLPPASVCFDEAPTNLVPRLKQNVGGKEQEGVLQLTAANPNSTSTGFFHWMLNGSSFDLDWAAPTDLDILNKNAFPTSYNTYQVPQANQWVYWVIQETGQLEFTHPIHMHGHDFWVLDQGSGTFNSSSPLNTNNPVRRDVAALQGGGYLVIAFFSDNPGAWLLHCHIAWHASQGLAMQFVERQSEIAGKIQKPNDFQNQCKNWSNFYETVEWPQDDSGI